MSKKWIIIGGSIVVLGILGFVFKDKIKAMVSKGEVADVEEVETKEAKV